MDWTWDDLSEHILCEADEAGWHPLADWNFEAPEKQAMWTLLQEKMYLHIIEAAFEHRLKTGNWPSDLIEIQRWLVGLRLHHVADMIRPFKTLNVQPVPQPEDVIKAFAVKEWPENRFETHMIAALPDWVDFLFQVPDPFHRDYIGPVPQWPPADIM